MTLTAAIDSNAAHNPPVRTCTQVLFSRGQGPVCEKSDETFKQGVVGSSPTGPSRGQSIEFGALTCGQLIIDINRDSNGIR
jgi:hypothetical protein